MAESMGDCEWCGKLFTGKQKTARHCSPECRQKAYDARNSEAVRWSRLHRLHGITKDDWFALVAKQNGLCAVCQIELTDDPVTDHCHDTGRVRGILCRKCNTGIGLLGDDPANLLRAYRYLRDE